MEDSKEQEVAFDRGLVWKIYKPLTEEEEKMVEKLRRSMDVEIIKMYESD
jgi:hypothetical protein